MQDPYNYPFIQKGNTMYLSTITKNDFASKTDYNRESTFQRRDIDGTLPKTLIPQQPNATNFTLSTYVQPIPNRYKQINKVSNPLRVDDIQGARPKVCDFKTNRIVDPLQPVYQLPTANQISMDRGRNFIRDTLTIQDINNKKNTFLKQRGMEVLKQPVEGSKPMPLTKYVNANQRLEVTQFITNVLQVRDINKDGIFESTRHTNPLQPNYYWRDNQNEVLKVNHSYGQIEGTQPKMLYPQVNKVNNFMFNTRDIEGTTTNSAFNRSHMMDKRTQFRNYMNIKDIEKTDPSSLKKGIQTKRATNPLMPKYQFPGHSELPKK